MAIPREPKVAVVGATGGVGGQILQLIAEREFPAAQIKLFATANGAAGTVEKGDEEYLVEVLDDLSVLAAYDIAFLAVPETPARSVVAARPGPVLIDLSACGRAPSDLCPPVGPGLTTRDRVRELAARGVFEIPHPAAHVLATCLGSLGIAAGFVAVTVMLGASAGGRDMITKTVDQTTDLLRAQLDLEEETQRAFNAFMRDHERAIASAIAAQTKALLAATPQMVVQASGIPVLHGTALAIALPASPHPAGSSQDPLERLRSAPGVLLIEQGEPLAIADAVGQEAIMVSADRESGGLTVWAAFDNTRLAALNALWVAETLIHASPAAN